MTKKKQTFEQKQKAERKKNEKVNHLLRSRGSDSITVTDRPKKDPVSNFFNRWIRARASGDEDADPILIAHKKKEAEKKKGSVNPKLLESIVKMSDEQLDDILSDQPKVDANVGEGTGTRYPQSRPKGDKYMSHVLRAAAKERDSRVRRRADITSRAEERGEK